MGEQERQIYLPILLFCLSTLMKLIMDCKPYWNGEISLCLIFALPMFVSSLAWFWVEETENKIGRQIPPYKQWATKATFLHSPQQNFQERFLNKGSTSHLQPQAFLTSLFTNWSFANTEWSTLSTLKVNWQYFVIHSIRLQKWRKKSILWQISTALCIYYNILNPTQMAKKQ